MKWDTVISAIIIAFLALFIWGKFTHQTIPEVIVDIRDFFGGLTNG